MSSGEMSSCALCPQGAVRRCDNCSGAVCNVHIEDYSEFPQLFALSTFNAACRVTVRFSAVAARTLGTSTSHTGHGDVKVTTYEKMTVCTTCRDLFRMVDREGMILQVFGIFILLSGIICLPCWCYARQNPLTLWMTRLKRQFREYNTTHSPPFVIKIQKGKFTGYIYPHSHPEYKRSSSVANESDEDSVPLVSPQSAPARDAYE